MRLIAVCIFIFLLFCPTAAYAQLTINLVAVNPSNEVKKIDINYALPSELEPNDILDSGPLKLKFNVQKNSMIAHGDIAFQPKESRTFTIRVNDVWRIDPEEIGLLKEQLESTLNLVRDHENFESAEYMSQRLNDKMDFIMRQQEGFTGNIERRIEEYRANITVLEKIRDQIYNQDFLKFESKGLKELEESAGTITMVIEVKNPSDTKPLEVKHKHYLPKEVRSDAVLEKQDFELRFDEERDKMYVTKEEEFKAGEVKTYKIVLKDIWQFSELKSDDLDDRAQIATLELEGTGFQVSAERLYSDIQKKLEEIRVSKELDTSIERHIGLFRLNQRRYQQAYDDFKRIEEMISIVRAKKLQEMESKKVKNVLSRLKSLRGLKSLSEALFKQKLSVNVTWKIIFATIGFVAFFSSVHFFLWAKRSKTMGEEMGLKPGESITVVEKPGEKEEEEDDDD